MTTSTLRMVPVGGHRFTDTLDGYFTLQESVQQLLDRQAFECAWLHGMHAPCFEADSSASSPAVPFKLHADDRVGECQRFSVFATRTSTSTQLSGWADWSWLQAHSRSDNQFEPHFRLAEPAYVTGFGLLKGPLQTRAVGSVLPLEPQQAEGADMAVVMPASSDPQSTDILPFWRNAWVWAIDPGQRKIQRRDGKSPCVGERLCLSSVANSLDVSCDYLVLKHRREYECCRFWES